MSTPRRPVRLIVAAAIALGVAALVWFALSTARGIVDLAEKWNALPLWAQIAIGAIAAALLLALGAFTIWIAQPSRKAAPITAPPSRAEVEQRVEVLDARHADTSDLHAELVELDRRAHDEALYVAVFGEISAGKSSLVRALAPGATPATDVLGGTTRSAEHYAAQVDGLAVTFADVPGTHEIDGIARENIARDEALRAHIVLYVCAGDLTRDQDKELRWLRDFGKPIVLVLNKADRFSASQREALENALGTRYGRLVDANVVVSAGGREVMERHTHDGRTENIERERAPLLDALHSVLRRFAREGRAAFEAARSDAVLSSVQLRADARAAELREREARVIVDKYTRRAVVGALAAVMPGTDLVIQAVLGTGLVRELTKLYEVPVRDLDIEAFLAKVKLTLRTSASLVLAIAGNAAKAFPGLGTLGGGVLHAIAYGLIFDSLGRAIAQTLHARHALDQSAVQEALATLLADASGERLRRIAGYALHPTANASGEQS